MSCCVRNELEGVRNELCVRNELLFVGLKRSISPGGNLR